MDKQDIFALKEKVKDEYTARIKQLEDELKSKLDSIDYVTGLISGDSSVTVLKHATGEGTTQPAKRCSSTSLRKIIKGLGDEFSIRDIKANLLNSGSSDKLSRNVANNVFSQLIKNEEIEVIKKGKGRRPNLYKKTENYRGRVKLIPK